jgi:hypothetical protein
MIMHNFPLDDGQADIDFWRDRQWPVHPPKKILDPRVPAPFADQGIEVKCRIANATALAHGL